jgi:flagellar basal-body rod protein FlgC
VFSSGPSESPFAAVFQTEMGSGVTGVQVSDVVEDQRPPDRRYIPGHPDADAEGYVAFPNVNPAEDMANLVSASRGYQGNIAAMNAIKDMLHRSMDLMK